MGASVPLASLIHTERLHCRKAQRYTRLQASSNLAPVNGQIKASYGDTQRSIEDRPMNFDDVSIFNDLEMLSPAEKDDLPFGVITMNAESVVVHYNATESKLAGLSPDQVLGVPFFTDVAPCTNNYMVAGRFQEDELDATLDYVFTLRMKPSPVTLRLLKSAAQKHQYVLVFRK